MEMDNLGPAKAKSDSELVIPRKPRVLLAACGSVAAEKFVDLCHCFLKWAEVRAVVTPSSSRFIHILSIPRGVLVFKDGHEWYNWGQVGDSAFQFELTQWADVMVIAPLSANTLAKIAGGLCDTLLTFIVRSWDYQKPIFVAPSMNTLMWRNPLTEQHCMSIDELGIILIPPVSRISSSGDPESGEMAEPSIISDTVLSAMSKVKEENVGGV